MGILSAIRKKTRPEAGARSGAGNESARRNAFDELSRAAALLSAGTEFE